MATVPAAGERPDSRRARRIRRGQLALIATLVGLVFVAPTLFQHLEEGAPIPYSRIISELIGWYLWALFVPVVNWVVRRFPLERRNWRVRLLIYLGCGLLVSFAYAVVDVLKAQLIHMLVTGNPVPSLLRLGTGYLFGGIEFYLLVYSVMLAIVQAFDYYRRYQDRRLRASQLESELARAQLQVLRAQLNPHFLFNALNAIAALMHRDVEAADGMLVQLSDFLRLSLELGDQQEIPLVQELELLEHYLAIERLRFGGRVEFHVDVEPDAQGALVPSLVLQPLVENAIRHGVSKRAGGGRVEVRVRVRFPDRLELHVRDDGPGTPSSAPAIRPGVGLDNTRNRLRRLYGGHQRFEIGNAPAGGFQVMITIPLRHGDESADAAALGELVPVGEEAP